MKHARLLVAVCTSLAWSASSVALAEAPTLEPVPAPEPAQPDEPVEPSGTDAPDETPAPGQAPSADSSVADLQQQIEALKQQQAEQAAKIEALESQVVPPPPNTGEARGEATAQTPQALGWDRWTAGNAMATRVTFAFGDDNVLAGPRDRSPQAGFTLPNDQLFFEQLTQEKRGYETETQFVVYKRMRSYFKHLDAEAALVLEFQNFVNESTLANQTVIGDDGSYLKLNYYIKPNDFDGDVVSLTLFPFDSQRFLLGYTFDITWGGERIFPNNTGQVPGARLKYDFLQHTDRPGYAFIGAKTARLLNDEINEPQTYYGALGGFGVHFVKWFMLEMNGGYFQRGAFPPQGVQFPGIGGKTAQAFGGSTRATFHKGMPVGTSIDFRLFKYAPDATFLLTAPVFYDDSWALQVAAEFTALGQTLIKWEQADETVIQPAFAAASVNQFRWKKLRVNLNAIFRDLNYVLFNIPGIAPFRASPEEAKARPEFFIAGGVDYFFENTHLTPGASIAWKKPATYTSSGVTTVIRDEDDFETLPIGENAFDIFAAKATLSWDVAPFFIVVTELRYTLDKNRSKFVKSDNESGRERVFQAKNVTNRLGFFILAQARW
jgi:hypothetical protein